MGGVESTPRTCAFTCGDSPKADNDEAAKIAKRRVAALAACLSRTAALRQSRAVRAFRDHLQDRRRSADLRASWLCLRATKTLAAWRRYLRNAARLRANGLTAAAYVRGSRIAAAWHVWCAAARAATAARKVSQQAEALKKLFRRKLALATWRAAAKRQTLLRSSKKTVAAKRAALTRLTVFKSWLVECRLHRGQRARVERFEVRARPGSVPSITPGSAPLNRSTRPGAACSRAPSPPSSRRPAAQWPRGSPSRSSAHVGAAIGSCVQSGASAATHTARSRSGL